MADGGDAYGDPASRFTGRVFALEGVTMALSAQFLLSGISFLIAMSLLALMVYWPPVGSLILLIVAAALLSFLGTLEVCKRRGLAGSRKMPAAVPTAMAQGATLRLLIRPNQDPQELAKDNIWRWFVFKAMNQNPTTHETVVLGTYLFLTFDHPVATNYRRIFSPSNSNLHFDIIDFTARSMVIVLHNADLSGETIEVQISANPL